MRAEDLILVSVDDHVVEPPDLFEGHLPDKWMEFAPKSVQPRRHRRLGLRGQRDPQHRAQRGRGSAARGVQHRAHELRDDAQGLLRHRRARQRHEPQRRARLDVLPVLRAVLRAAVLALEGPRHGAQPPARPTTTGTSTSGAAPTRAGSSRCRSRRSGTRSSWPTRCAASPRRAATRSRSRRTRSSSGWPHIFGDHWDPFFAACEDEGTVICLHIGSSSTQIEIAPGAPIDVMITLTPLNTMQAATDLLWSPVLRKFPNLQVRALRGRHGLDPLLARADRLRVPAAPLLDGPGLRRRAPEPGGARPLHVLLHQRPRRRRRARGHRHRQHDVGVRLPALRLVVAELTRVGRQAARRRRRRRSSTRSRTRTRCGSSGTTRSPTDPRRNRAPPRCAPRRPPSPSPAARRCRSSGTSPASASIRTARSSSTSITIASPGCRSTMNRTTQSSHAFVCCITQLSQLISMARLARGCDSYALPYDQSGTGNSERGWSHQHAITRPARESSRISSTAASAISSGGRMPGRDGGRLLLGGHAGS